MAVGNIRTRFAIAAVLTSLVVLPARGDDARQSGPVGTPQGKERMQLHWVPVFVRGEATSNLIQMRLCRPDTNEPVAVAVINHGSPPKAGDRPAMKPASCTSEVARFFLARQIITAFPLRRGYGETGGAWAEGYRTCNRINYSAAGLATAADIDSAVSYLRTLPYVRGERMIVVGQSAGGWGALAYASLNPDHIVGFIDVAGGRGGHHNGEANSNCRPDELIAAAGVYGQTARQPMLWLFTQNDSFFSPGISRAMHEAFVKSGGRATYHLLPAWEKDGHNLFFGRNGSKVWGPIFDDYIQSVMPPG